jgi:chromosome segregation ATPase
MKKTLNKQENQEHLLRSESNNLREQVKDLKNKLDSLNHEYMYSQQTIRSLHWALNMATKSIANAQREVRTFAYEDESWIALAEQWKCLLTH